VCTSRRINRLSSKLDQKIAKMSNESPETANDVTAAVNVEAVSEQQPPAKKKRGASHQITKDGYDDADDDDSEKEEKLKQGFKRASNEVISKRKIFKVKRTFAAPKTAEAIATNGSGAALMSVSSTDKKAAATLGSGSNLLASTSTAPAAKASDSSNPFASTVLTSSSTEMPTEAGTTAKKVFGFGSTSGFGAATSASSTGNGSSGFGGGGGFAGVGTGGKPSGFGSSSSSASGSTPSFIFGSSSAVVAGGDGGGGGGSDTPKSLFGNIGASSITFSLSKKSDNSKDSTAMKAADTTNTTTLPDKVDLKTGEEDEETIHSGRCKSFIWVVEDNSGRTDGDSADGNDDDDDQTSPTKNKTNLSVQSSTQFQAAISSSKPKAASITSSNDDIDQNDAVKGAKSASDATPENGTGIAVSAFNSSDTSVKHRWVELGIGPVKILRSKSNPERLRLVQRRESSKMGPATKVILNVPLWNESSCERDRQAQQYLRLKTMKDGKMCQYSLKFKENTDAGYFHHHLTDHIPLARQCFSETAAATAGKTSETIIAQQRDTDITAPTE